MSLKKIRLKEIFYALLITLLMTLISSISVQAQEGVDIYRLNNPSTGEHLYTPYQDEANNLNSSGWTLEGTGWVAPQSGKGVYRLFNPSISDHLYTTDESEVSILSGIGWTGDNNTQAMFFASDSGIPVYRLYNESTKRHLLTTDANEYNTLATVGWTQEGVAFYGIGEGISLPAPTPPNNVTGQKLIAIPTFIAAIEFPSSYHVQFTPSGSSSTQDLGEIPVTPYQDASGRNTSAVVIDNPQVGDYIFVGSPQAMRASLTITESDLNSGATIEKFLRLGE